MNAFTDDVKKIAIPTMASQATFQQPVAAMDVFSNVKEITTGTNIETGNIEFWPNNYGPAKPGTSAVPRQRSMISATRWMA